MIVDSYWPLATWGLAGAIIATLMAPAAEREMLSLPYPRLPAACATALLFGSLATWEGGQTHLAADCCVAAVGVPLLVVDSATMRLPSNLTTPLLISIAFASCVSAAVGRDGVALLRAFIGMGLQGAFYLALWFAARERLGGGDVKLAVPLALACGWHGWSAIFLLNAVASLFTLFDIALSHRARGAYPMGPGLVVAAAIATIVAP